MLCLMLQIETTPKVNNRAAEEFVYTSEQGQFGLYTGPLIASVLSNKFPAVAMVPRPYENKKTIKQWCQVEKPK